MWLVCQGTSLIYLSIWQPANGYNVTVIYLQQHVWMYICNCLCVVVCKCLNMNVTVSLICQFLVVVFSFLIFVLYFLFFSVLGEHISLKFLMYIYSSYFPCSLIHTTMLSYTNVVWLYLCLNSLCFCVIFLEGRIQKTIVVVKTYIR